MLAVVHKGERGKVVGKESCCTHRPSARWQPTQSSSTVSSLFISQPLGVPAAARVPTSLGSMPSLELGSVLCNAAGALAKLELEGVGVCTR